MQNEKLKIKALKRAAVLNRSFAIAHDKLGSKNSKLSISTLSSKSNNWQKKNSYLPKKNYH
ncbi:MAG: hypothetical protein AB1743_10235 [Actinomycetota bacterium]